MMELAITIVLAGAIGMVGASLGVRDLKRKAAITIERGRPRPLPNETAFPSDVFGETP